MLHALPQDQAAKPLAVELPPSPEGCHLWDIEVVLLDYGSIVRTCKSSEWSGGRNRFEDPIGGLNPSPATMQRSPQHPLWWINAGFTNPS